MLTEGRGRWSTAQNFKLSIKTPMHTTVLHCIITVVETLKINGILPAVIYKLNCKHRTLSKCYLKVCVKFSSVPKFSYDLACGFLSLQVKSFLGT